MCNSLMLPVARCFHCFTVAWVYIDSKAYLVVVCDVELRIAEAHECMCFPHIQSEVYIGFSLQWTADYGLKGEFLM